MTAKLDSLAMVALTELLAAHDVRICRLREGYEISVFGVAQGTGHTHTDGSTLAEAIMKAKPPRRKP